MASLPTLCPQLAGLDHRILPGGSPCPFCHQFPSQNPAAGPSRLPLTLQPAQYTPITPGAVAAIQQAANSAAAGRRNKGKASTPSTANQVPAIPEVFKFLLKIAHARIEQGKDSTYHWIVFSDSYVITLKSDVQVEFRVLKSTFRAQAQKYPISVLRQQTQPQGRGHWGLASNHLNPDRPEPRLWVP
jgi:hypothetical protein